MSRMQRSLLTPQEKHTQVSYQNKSSESKNEKNFSQRSKKYQRKSNTKKKKGRIPWLWILFHLTWIFLFCGALAVGYVYKKYLNKIPDVRDIEKEILREANIIYDREGNELYRFGTEKRIYITYNQLGKNMIDAIVSAEDQRFFEHKGLDYIGLARTALSTVMDQKIAGGASTIPQQLIKNTLLHEYYADEQKRSNEIYKLYDILKANPEKKEMIQKELKEKEFALLEKKVERKIKEMFLSRELSAKYDKQKILEMYLNKIDFGANAHGIEQASLTFFGKSVFDANVLETAILAGIVNAPSRYSPYNHRNRLMGYAYVYEDPDILKTLPVETPAIGKKVLGEEKNTSKKTQEIYLDTPENVQKYFPFLQSFQSYIQGLTFTLLKDEKLKICGLQKKYYRDETTLSIGPDGCSTGNLDYNFIMLQVLGEMKIQASDIGITKPELQHIAFEYYAAGRKDFVLLRMLVDKKITPEVFKQSLLEGLTYEFKPYRENIKFPHFVMYVIEHLENEYGKDFLAQGGLRIYTSIDPDLQEQAEAFLREQQKISASQYGAYHNALIALDNTTGNILAMARATSYFDEDKKNDGQVNITNRPVQPGSSFKPFVYALAISKPGNKIGSHTPIFDLKLEGGYSPFNYDGGFEGLMNVSTSLNGSRNTTAVKMAYLAGGEQMILDFISAIGITSPKRDQEKRINLCNGNPDIVPPTGESKQSFCTRRHSYGMPIALGTANTTPLEMAHGYMTFANNGKRKRIEPIIRIIDIYGNPIVMPEPNEGIEVIDPAVAAMMNKILSDSSTRPTSWNADMTLSGGRKVAGKTGTSNKDKQVGNRKIIAPSDLWMTGYTPQITTVVWSGNIKGEVANSKAAGLFTSAPVWKKFMEYVHTKKNLPLADFQSPANLTSMTISKISGKSVGKKTPQSFKIGSLFVSGSEPSGGDESFRNEKVDILCGGNVTENTPERAVQDGIYIDITPIIESTNDSWMKAVKNWYAGEGFDEVFSEVTLEDEEGKTIPLITDVAEKICERPAKAQILVETNFSENVFRAIGKNDVNIGFSSPHAITTIELLRDGELFHTKELSGETRWIESLYFDESFVGKHQFTIRLIDEYYYTYDYSYPVTFEKEDTNPPLITITNPSNMSIQITQNQSFTFSGTLQDTSSISVARIEIDNTLYKIMPPNLSFQVVINSEKTMPPGVHFLKIVAIDANMLQSEKSVKITVLPDNRPSFKEASQELPDPSSISLPLDTGTENSASSTSETSLDGVPEIENTSSGETGNTSELKTSEVSETLDTSEAGETKNTFSEKTEKNTGETSETKIIESIPEVSPIEDDA